MGDIALDGISSLNNVTLGDIASAIESEYIYNLLLWGPFILIPGCILGARLIKYLYKMHQSMKYGYDEDFDDPLRQLGLAQLGITLNRGYDDLNDIRKIRKEQKKACFLEKRILNKNKKPENEGLLLEESIKNSVAPEFIARPLFLAENYLATFHLQTQKTYMDHLSPEAVSRWFDSSAFGRFWMMFQVACTFISIINYVFLTYAIQKDERTFIKYLDVVLAGIFCADYAISIYIAEDRLAFYFNYSSLIDLISIVPPFIYLVIGEHSQFFWFLGLLRILRASRILRTYRLLSFSETEEKREVTIVCLTFCNFIFLSASIINALETINLERKSEASLLNWHDSLYYIMVTFSTIGFGDLTPSSTLSRVVVIILIIFVIIYVPVQTNRISEIYSATSLYQRAKFSPKSRQSSHVVLAGSVTYSAIVDFAKEFFAATSDISTKIVILAQCEPDLETRKLLRHPAYRTRLSYLYGSALSNADLKRAATKYATALFLINKPVDTPDGDDEQTSIARGLDTEILMESLVAKKMCPGIPVLAEVLDIRSEDMSQHCGSDRVLCSDKLKLALMARECLVPGFLALILNIICKYSNHSSLQNNEPWLYNYTFGASNQIFSLKVPPGLCNLKWDETVENVFKAFNVTIFAVMSSSGLESGKIRLNPGKDYVMRGDDVVFCLTSGGDEVVLRMSLQFKDSIPRTQLEILELESELNAKLTPRATTATNEKVLPKAATKLEFGNFDDSNNHIIVCGNLTGRATQQFILNIRKAENDIFSSDPILEKKLPVQIICLRKVPVETSAVDSETGIWSVILKDENVKVITGSALKKSSLIACGIERCRRVVIFPTPTAKFETANAHILPDANSIFIIKMIQENWPTTNFVVELLCGLNVRYLTMGPNKIEWDTENLRMQSVLNNYTLSITDRISLYKTMRQYRNENGFFSALYKFIWPQNNNENLKPTQPRRLANVNSPANEVNSIISTESAKPILENPAGHSQQGIDEITEPSGNASSSVTAAYLQKLVEQAELDESGFSPFMSCHLDKNFAMGRVVPASFLHSMLAQLYFRPYIGEIISALSGSVAQVRVPAKFIGCKYTELLTYFLSHDMIPLGLYRLAGSQEAGSEWQAGMRYTYTNCRGIDILEKEDFVFVIPKSPK